MDGSTAWKAALVQGVSVAVLAVVLALALPRSFFEDFGWAAGPGAWAACALLTARVLRLPPLLTLGGAALAGVPSVLAVIAGRHWLGVPLALALFAFWCGWIAARGQRAQRDGEDDGDRGRRPSATTSPPPGPRTSSQP